MGKKLLALILTFVIAVSGFSMSTFAAKKDKDEKDPPALIRLSPEDVKTTKRSVIVYHKDISVTNVSKVFFDEKEISHPLRFTVKRTDDGGVAVILRQSFLDKFENGEHNLRIEYTKHSLEMPFEVNNENSAFNEEPPRTRKVI